MAAEVVGGRWIQRKRFRRTCEEPPENHGSGSREALGHGKGIKSATETLGSGADVRLAHAMPALGQGL